MLYFIQLILIFILTYVLDYLMLFRLAHLQVECHPYLTQSQLLDFCKSKDIVLVAHSALGTQRHKLW